MKKRPLKLSSRTLFVRDNIDVLPNINSEMMDLIYLDPPFNSNRYYFAPVKSKAARASFKKAFKNELTLRDMDKAWFGQIAESHPELSALITAVGKSGGKGDMDYLTFMARRLLEIHRILKSTGSVYLHCPPTMSHSLKLVAPTMSHSLKLVMDCIFGKKNFRNEIVWCYRGAGYPKNDFGKRHDVLLRYSKTQDYTFNLDAVREEYTEATKQRLNPLGKHPDDWWQIQPITLSAKERTGYPTQKPIALLEKIIKASSNEGDVVFDPFCGCSTALVAAEQLRRQWIGIDISSVAKQVIKSRLEDSQNLLTTKGVWKKIVIRADFPTRTDKRENVVNPKEYKHELFGIQKGQCVGCCIEFPYRNLEIDHIIPQSKGGGNTKKNLQLLCSACNKVKCDRSMSYLRAQLKE